MKKTLENVVAVVGSLTVCGVLIGGCFFLACQKTNNNAHEGVNNHIEPITRHEGVEPWEYDDAEGRKLFYKMSERADAVLGNITDVEREAVGAYVHSDYYSIVEFIKGEKISNKAVTPELLKRYVNLISELIKKSRLEEDVRLYRGTNLDCLNKVLSKDEIEKIANAASEPGANDIVNKLKGKDFSSNGFFVSTSTSYEVAAGKLSQHRNRSVFIKIHAKKGLNYLPIMQYCKWHENEVLLGRDLKLRIKNAELRQNLLGAKQYLYLECETIN